MRAPLSTVEGSSKFPSSVGQLDSRVWGGELGPRCEPVKLHVPVLILQHLKGSHHLKNLSRALWEICPYDYFQEHRKLLMWF